MYIYVCVLLHLITLRYIYNSMCLMNRFIHCSLVVLACLLNGNLHVFPQPFSLEQCGPLGLPGDADARGGGGMFPIHHQHTTYNIYIYISIYGIYIHIYGRIYI